MNGFFSQLGDQLSRIWAGLGIPQKVTLVLFVAGSALLIGALSYWQGSPDYVPLVSGLSTEELTSASAKLKDANIPVRYEASRGLLSVPSGKLDDARMALAALGLSNGGNHSEGFEAFDKQSFGMTDFAQKVNYQRALQSSLERKVAALDGVEKAQITLTLPDEEVFARETTPPKASVEVKLKRGHDLSGGQVAAIRHLVAAAVPKLKPQNVAVMDSEGRLLARFQGAEDGSGSLSSGDQLEAQSRTERHLSEKVEAMLDHVLGPGRAAVQITAQLDFEAIERTVNKMDPESQVTLTESLQSTESQNLPSTGGVPGVKSNTPGAEGTTTAGAGSPGQLKKEKTVNNKYHYDTITEVVKPGVGTLKRLSVAVLVKQRLSSVAPAAGGAAPDPAAKPEKKFEPLSGAELARLTDAVKNAVGYSADRKDVVKVENAPAPVEPDEAYAPTSVPEPGVNWLELLSKHGSTLAMLAAVLVLAQVFRSSMRTLSTPVAEPVQPDETSTANAAGPTGPPMHKILQNEISTLVTQNSTQATEVIRTMLNR